MSTCEKDVLKEAEQACAELRLAIGAAKVKDDEIVLESYCTDYRTTSFRRPGMVVLPECREDVVEILKVANKYKIPVTVQARGNHAYMTIPSEGGMVLDFRRMNKIIKINTDSGYAIIEPGVTFDDFTAALREKGFRCHVPTAPGGATPLGNYLIRPAGSLATRHLDSIQDLEVVLPDGTVFNTGSSSFPEVGSQLRYGPYPDLAGLLVCSYGTLGVVTKAAVKIYPINESTQVILTAFDNFPSAVDYVKDITNHNIPEHCIIWNYQLNMTFGFALDIAKPGAEIPSGMKGDPKQPPEGYPYSIVTVNLSGYEETVATNIKVCEMVAKKYGGRVLTDREAEEMMPVAKAGYEQLYTQYHQPEPTFFGLGSSPMWITLAEPKDIKDLEKWAVDKIDSLGVRPVCYYVQPFDYGRSMMFRIFIFPDPRDQKVADKIKETFGQMFGEAMKRYGAVPMRHSPMSNALPQTGSYGEVLTRIKKVLDPNNILNPAIGIFKEE